MSDLLNSQWAPNAPPQRTSHMRAQPGGGNRIAPSGSLLPPAEELSRFMKIVARLRWKLPFLAEGYRLATREPGENEADEVAHAEIMFKLDFHEYYALLERAIVHLLAVFNVTVSSSWGVNGNGQPVGVHRYHANVLEALREQTTPLFPILGSGPIHMQLQRAKELRNKWKTADLTMEERERQGEGNTIVPLREFDFEVTLSSIFGGLEESYARAKNHVDKCVGPDEVPSQTNAEAGWEFMVDAMDWEAV